MAKPWFREKCDWAGRDWASEGKDPASFDAAHWRHYLVRVPEKIDKPAWYDQNSQAHAVQWWKKGFTRYCNRCYRGDATQMCSERNVGAAINPGTNWCSSPAKVWEDGKGFCGLHNPSLKRERAAKWREVFDAKMAASDLHYKRFDAEREIVKAAKEWRRWHFTDAPCLDSCEHVDCLLARKVDLLTGLG